MSNNRRRVSDSKTLNPNSTIQVQPKSIVFLIPQKSVKTAITPFYVLPKDLLFIHTGGCKHKLQFVWFCLEW